MQTRLNKETEQVWTRLVTVTGVLMDRVEAALKDQGLPPLSWYDVLLEVERAGPSGIRPYEIKDRLLLPQYGTSRLLKRLTEAGYVETGLCDDDGRGQVISITESGRDVRRRMWPVYAGALRENVQSKLTADEAQTLTALLSRLDPV